MTTSTTFSDGTVVTAAWLNTVDAHVYDYSINVKDYGAVGDGVTDDYAAFVAAIAALSITLSPPNYSGKGVLEIPPGIYYLSNTLNLEHQITLRGHSSPAGNSWSVSRLKWPTGKTGIVIHSAQTSSTGKDAAGTLIENLTLYTTRGSAAVEAGRYGVLARTRFYLRNCVVALFGDSGVSIDADSGVTGNANSWQIEHCRLAENGYDGLTVEGADANAGVATGVDCSSNLRWGFFDDSFLGNTYVGCHTAANIAGGYKTTNVNGRCAFLGCYTEGGQTSEITHPGLIVGGTWGVSDPTGTAPFLDSADTALRIKNADIVPFKAIDFTSATRTATVSCLDAYLEGTWTPTVTNVSLAAGAPSSATYEGHYTVIGNMVYWNIIITPANTTTIAFTTNTTTLTLPGSHAPAVASVATGIPLLGSTTFLGVTKTDGKVYPRTLGATNDTIILSGTYRRAS